MNWLLSFIPGPWAIALRVGLYVACFLGGVWVANKFHDAAQLAAVNEARADERYVARVGFVSEDRYLKTLRMMKEVSDGKIDTLRRRLAAVPACPVPVPPEWLRQPVGVPGPAGTPGRAESGAPAVDTTADARDVVIVCERNRLEVHEPNAVQLRAIQDWYNEVRRVYNEGR